MRKAIVLLSGGLDSATTLYLAKRRGYKCSGLIFDYGQRHKKEIRAAQKIARGANCKSKVLKISLPWKGSSLLNKKLGSPQLNNAITQKRKNEIPSTYVPARNIIFLSFALSYAEAMGAGAIFIGAHSQDYSGYPDCRQGFYQAFNKVIKQGTKSGTQGKGIKIITPLIGRNKAEIIKIGEKLGVPFELTWSCYQGRSQPCGECESCYYRAKGFAEAGISDPLLKGRPSH